MAVSIVGCRLDYCNSVGLLYGMSQANSDKLQRVQQNILARVVVGAPWTSSTLNIRRDLHWLPGDHRITYKLSHNLVKHFIPLSLSTCLNSVRTIFHPDPCVLPIQISLLDQPVSLATFPLGPFLCLHLLLETLYLHTFVLSTPYPPLNAT